MATVKTSITHERIDDNSALAPGRWDFEQASVETTSNLFNAAVSQAVSTTHELLTVGDLPNPMICLIKNIHATAIVEVGVEVAATFYPLFNIPPGEICVMPRLTDYAGTYVESDVINSEILIACHQVL